VAGTNDSGSKFWWERPILSPPWSTYTHWNNLCLNTKFV